MKEFKFCGEMTEYVEIPVMVCETQKEMVSEISEVREVSFNDYVYEQVALIENNRQLSIKNQKEYGYSAYYYDEQIRQIVGTGDETSIYVIYKDGSTYFETFGERQGKFKRYGIKAAVIETAFEYTVYGDFAVTDNGDISIEESDIEEYGVYNGQYDVKEEPEATAETVESVEETTVSETETVEETAEQEETEVKTKMYWAAVRNKETNQLEVIKRDDYSSKKDFAHDLRANGYAVRFISTPDKFDEDCENYYWECEKRQNVRKCVSESKERMEIAEQETELNAEVAEVEAEQTAEQIAEQTEENNIAHTVNRGRKSKGLNGYEQTVFSKRLKALHENTNEKQADTAANLGVTRQSFNNWLNAVNEPDFATLIKIAKYYNISVDYLLGLSDIESLDSNIKTSCTTTGLSQAAVEKLALWTSDDDKSKLWADYLSYYITSPDFEKALEYINKAHNCYNGDLNEDVIVKLWQVSRKIEVVTESLIEFEEIPKTGYFDTS